MVGTSDVSGEKVEPGDEDINNVEWVVEGEVDEYEPTLIKNKHLILLRILVFTQGRYGCWNFRSSN